MMAEVSILILVLSTLNFRMAKKKVCDALWPSCKLAEVLDENIQMFKEIAAEIPELIAKMI